MMSAIYLVTGVNGIGKSSVIPFLAKETIDKGFVIHDFDERGVPDNADKAWRISELKHWLSEGELNKQKGISTIICGYMKPDEIHDAASDCIVILLDANSGIITKRVLGRYGTPESITELTRTTGKTPEKFASDNEWVSQKFREAAKEYGYTIIDTSELEPSEVATEILKLL